MREAYGRSDATNYTDEVIACCGIMQLAFLTGFYGGFASWTYYYYILIIGLAAIATRGSLFSRADFPDRDRGRYWR